MSLARTFPSAPGRPWLLAATLAFCAATPGHAAVGISASPTGPASIVFDGLSGYGGSLGAAFSLPVNLRYDANQPGGATISGNNVAGLLAISFSVSASAQRNFYPYVDPFVKQSGAREGASWSGTFDTMTVLLTIPNDGNPLTLLSLTTTAPVANFVLNDFITYQTDGRGLKLEQVFGASSLHNGKIQTGNCHISYCNLPGPASFTLASDILNLGQTIQPGSYKGLVLGLGEPDAAFTAGPDTDFTVPFRFLTFSSAVPEPATWSLMIIGFGFIGHGLRRMTQRCQHSPTRP